MGRAVHRRSARRAADTRGRVGGVSTRAYVANTMAYRRRKGTAVVLEQLARDTTGWPARAVEFFQRLATTQHMNHVRLAPPARRGMRDAAAAELADSAVRSVRAHARNAHVSRPAAAASTSPTLACSCGGCSSYAVGAGTPGDESPDFASARELGALVERSIRSASTRRSSTARTETTIAHLAEEQNVPGRAAAPGAERGAGAPARRASRTPRRFMTTADPVLRVFVRARGEPGAGRVRREDIYLCEIPDDVELASPVPRALALDPSAAGSRFPAARREESGYRAATDSPAISAADLTTGARVSRREPTWDRVSSTGEVGGFLDIRHLAARRVTPAGRQRQRHAFSIAARRGGGVEPRPPGRTGVIVLMDSLSGRRDAGGRPRRSRSRSASARGLLIVAGNGRWSRSRARRPAALRRAGPFRCAAGRAHLIGDLPVRGTAAADSPSAGACSSTACCSKGGSSSRRATSAQLGLAHCTVIPGRGALAVQPAATSGWP